MNNIQYVSESFDTCQKYNTEYTLKKVFGVFRKYRAKIISKVSVDSRISTYNRDLWNKIPVSIHELAEAGFFSNNKLDQVTCYCCAISLWSWDLTDSPWIEHAKVAQNCLLIDLNQDIIEREKKSYNNLANMFIKIWFETSIGKQLKDLFPICDVKKVLYKRFNDKKLMFETFAEAYDEMTSLKEKENESKYPCSICFEREKTITFLPCGHLSCCTFCAPCVDKCPLGGEDIIGCVRSYIC